MFLIIMRVFLCLGYVRMKLLYVTELSGLLLCTIVGGFGNDRLDTWLEIAPITDRSERSQVVGHHGTCTGDVRMILKPDLAVGQSSLTAGGYILGFGTASI